MDSKEIREALKVCGLIDPLPGTSQYIVKQYLSTIDPGVIRREARAVALLEVKEEIRQAGETAIEVGYEGAYIRGLDKAIALVSSILSAEKWNTRSLSTIEPEVIRQALDVSSDCVRIVLGAIVDNQLREALTKSLECHDEIYAILGTEPAQGDIGTDSNPFKGTYNAVVFQRHDSGLKCGICERDDGFEFVVHGTNKESSHYTLHPNALMERLDEPAQDDGITKADLQEVIDDYRRLTKELDVALNGNDAAQSPSLCDIVSQVKVMNKPVQDDGKAEAIDVFAWLMGMVGDFPERPSKNALFWWRKDLVKRLELIGISWADLERAAEVKRRIEEAKE